MTQEVFALLIAIAMGILIGGLVASAACGDEVKSLKRKLQAFDHDGDGRPGGSRKRS